MENVAEAIKGVTSAIKEGLLPESVTLDLGENTGNWPGLCVALHGDPDEHAVKVRMFHEGFDRLLLAIAAHTAAINNIAKAINGVNKTVGALTEAK
jgi:hypothetical protein